MKIFTRFLLLSMALLAGTFAVTAQEAPTSVKAVPPVPPTAPASGRPILGIYPEETDDASGIRIGSLSTSKGVAAAGLQAGDVITGVAGRKVTGSHDLRQALAGRQPGEPVQVRYLRGGQELQATVTLAREGGSRANTWRNPCDVFIGVGTSHRQGEGLHVDYIVENTAAERSDVRAGDVIVALDEVRVNTQLELELERDKHQPGEVFTLQILRAGQPMTINARFNSCSAEELQKARAAGEARAMMRNQWSNYTWNMDQAVKRDTCAVFIGIYSHRADEGGRRVDGVIKGTPAEKSGVRKGDIILAMDDVKVNTHDELVQERDKRQPGERFTLSVLRDGQYVEIDAQFKSCTEPAVEATVPAQVAEAAAPVNPPLVEPSRQLKVAEWKAYPNPTFGKINVQFQAEAVPTTVQVLDAGGKVVYEEQLNGFDGYYQEQLNLGNNLPGVYLLVVRQGEQVFYNKVVLLSKA
jgi:S1-C subfamily serine protease